MNLIRYFVAAYPRRSAITLVCLIAAALAEGVGLATALPLIAIAIGEGEATSAPASREIAEGLASALALVGLPFTLITVAIVVSLLFVLKAALLLVSMRQVGNTVAWIATDLRLRLLTHLFAARWTYYSAHRLGRLTNAIATEATRAADCYRQLALAAKYSTLSIVGLGVAFWLSWQLALLTLVGWGLIALALGRLVRMSRRAGEKQTHVINSLLSRLADALLNVKLLKTMKREGLIGPLLTSDTDRLQKALRKQVLAQEAMNALQEPLMLMMLLVTLLIARAVGLLGFEEVMVMLIALARSLVGATKIQRRYQLAVTGAPALESLQQLVSGAELAVEDLHGGCAPVLDRAIELRGVRFAHDDQQVLGGVDLEVPAGEITALIGGSGGGKTTITDIVSGLLRPDAGVVEVDGVPLDDIDLAAWRSMIGYVPQELVLLHDSVRTNVTFGDPLIPDSEVEAALRAAGVWDVVCAMPGGLDASVGERGTVLSGGQRARIGLARALAARPSLLILDEATAALDPETETLVLETLRGLRGRVTVLAISHQPALAEIADRVYRVEAGRADRVAADPADRDAAAQG